MDSRGVQSKNLGMKTDFGELMTGNKELELIEFREFLRELYTSENLTFWLEVEEFKLISDINEINRRANEMWLKYFQSESPYELNIPDFLKKDLKDRVAHKRFDSQMFNAVQNSIFQLMADDSYPKFTQSDRFKSLRDLSKSRQKPQLKRTASLILLQNFVRRQRKKSVAVQNPSLSSPTTFESIFPNLDSDEAPLYHKEGFLFKLSRSSWRRRWFDVKDGVLSMYDSKKKLKDMIPLSLSTMNRFKPDKLEFAFEVRTPLKTLILKATDDQLMSSWLDMLKKQKLMVSGLSERVESGNLNFMQVIGQEALPNTQTNQPQANNQINNAVVTPFKKATAPKHLSLSSFTPLNPAGLGQQNPDGNYNNTLPMNKQIPAPRSVSSPSQSVVSSPHTLAQHNDLAVYNNTQNFSKANQNHRELPARPTTRHSSNMVTSPLPSKQTVSQTPPAKAVPVRNPYASSIIPPGGVLLSQKQNIVTKPIAEDESIYFDKNLISTYGKVNITPKLSPEEIILLSFNNHNSTPWTSFSKTLCSVLQESPAKVKRLESLLGRTGYVSREEWVHFIKWFSPVVVFNDYQSVSKLAEQIDDNQVEESDDGYTFSEIVDIVSPMWFFIDLPREKFRTALTTEGSFLFRFSSKGIGVYTLSVMNGDKDIGHWRINTKKISSRVPPIFEMQGNVYTSLHEIVRVFSESPLESAEDKTFKKVCLQRPADRTSV